MLKYSINLPQTVKKSTGQVRKGIPHSDDTYIIPKKNIVYTYIVHIVHDVNKQVCYLPLHQFAEKAIDMNEGA